MIVSSSNLAKAEGILGILVRQYERNPEKVLIQVGEQQLTYKELIEKGERVASALYEMGVRHNDRVGILCPNNVNWYIFLYAAVRVGAVVAPFDPQMGKYEIKYLFDKVGIRVVLTTNEQRGIKHTEILASLSDELLDLKKVVVDGECEANQLFVELDTLMDHEKIELPEFELTPESSNIFICTTGSTGNPKIVDLPCRIINGNIEKNAALWGFAADSKFFLTMPLYHAAGFGWGLSCLSAGGTIYYDNAFLPTKLLEKIQTVKITKMLSTPTLMKILLSHRKIDTYDLSSLKQLIFTGEYLSDELMSVFVDKYGMRVINALGMTETFVFLMWDSLTDQGIVANHLGKIPGIDIKVANEEGIELPPGEKGLINIKNSVMKGYYRLEDVTKETISSDGWLNSGDLATVTPEGRVVFSGRKKRVIKRGGNLVSPEEIEQFLKTYPTCVAVVIDNEPDEIIGERIVAYVQVAEGEKLTKDELLEFCKGNISAYKIPDDFYFIKEVPKTVGKVNQTKLRAMKNNSELELLN